MCGIVGAVAQRDVAEILVEQVLPNKETLQMACKDFIKDK